MIYIFDFNGTLLDDCDVCLKILNILTKQNNLEYVSKEKYLDIFTFPVINYYKELGFDVDNFKDTGNKFHEYYNKMSPTEASIFPEAYQLLKELKAENNTLVCLSASEYNILVKQLKYYNIYDYFDVILGLDNNFAYSKEKIAKDWLNNNHIDPLNCLLIGDSIHDKEVADSLNIKCYLVATGHTAKYRLLKETNNVIDNLLDLKKVL